MARYFLCLLYFFLTLPSRAHDPNLSGIQVTVGKGLTQVSVTTHLSQLSRAEGKSEPLDALGLEQALRRRVRLRFEGKDFAPAKTRLQRDEASDLVTWQATLPGEHEHPEVLERLYPDDPNARLVVSVVRDGKVLQESFLDATQTSPPPLAESPKTVFLRFLREGVAHIFGGPDHLCFVLGLLLLGGGLKQLLKTVTAFTLAHSITLTIAALGLWTPPARVVEPLIALSIVAIALENLRKRPRVRHEIYAFGFGLIHGFGFAGALAEVGLPQQALGAALAAFNLGVECGQALIVVSVAPALAKLADDHPERHGKLVRLLAVGIGLAGLWWLFQRL